MGCRDVKAQGYGPKEIRPRSSMIGTEDLGVRSIVFDFTLLYFTLLYSTLLYFTLHKLRLPLSSLDSYAAHVAV